MSVFKPSPFLFLSRRLPLSAASIRANHWNKDYKPGPYTEDLEQRIQAAEKYNLHPSEYEPYSDDGTGLGDYPKLPDIGIEARDPYYPWDNPELKRNFNEPFHAEYGLVREDRYNVGKRFRYPLWLQWVQFLGAMLSSWGLMWVFEEIKMFHPLTPRQYPEEGKIHYTFEAAEKTEGDGSDGSGGKNAKTKESKRKC